VTRTKKRSKRFLHLWHVLIGQPTSVGNPIFYFRRICIMFAKQLRAFTN